MEQLLQAPGVGINAMDFNGNTPFLLAKDKGVEVVIELLWKIVLKYVEVAFLWGQNAF